MDTFIISAFVTSTVLMLISFFYFTFFDKSGESVLYLVIISVVWAFFSLVSAHNDDKHQRTNKCECTKESIDTTSYPIIYIT